MQTDCEGTSENDYLLGVALKFEDRRGTTANLLFSSSVDGIRSPAFFAADTRLATVTSGGSSCGATRVYVRAFFGGALSELRAGGFEAADTIDRLPVDTLVPGSSVQRLELMPLVHVDLPPGGSDVRPRQFLQTLATHERLTEGASLFDVIATYADHTSAIVASLSLRTRFRISKWADEQLFFAHPGRPGESVPREYLKRTRRIGADQGDQIRSRRDATALDTPPRRRLDALCATVVEGGSIDDAARLTGLRRTEVAKVIQDFRSGGLDGAEIGLAAIAAGIEALLHNKIDDPNAAFAAASGIEPSALFLGEWQEVLALTRPTQ